LLQQRSFQKYHFGGRWTNTCCSHPRRNESIEAAAHRRLQEEFGFDTSLQEIFSFVYQAHDAESGLTEREFDHVFIGEFNGEPKINEAEIAAWKWMHVAELQLDVEKNPERYTAWFLIALDKVLDFNRSGSA
jgi:isopentenyl-diphosphate delta-isomerase